MYVKTLLLSLAAIVAASASWANKPAVAYTEAGKFDSSFNEAVYREGVVPYKAQFGADLLEKNPDSPTQFVAVLTELARQGRSPIVAVGFSYAEAVTEVAQAFPDTQFTIIDAVVDLPNVQSIVFKEHEGSFVVGAVAALKAEKDILGFIGGVDLPFIRRFGCGFAQGAHYINDKSQVYMKMVAKDFSGFANVERGGELAEELINQNVEVIYAAAGGSGNGVYKAASRYEDVYAIGVDSNQNFLHVGTMLTSMVKKVGVAAYGSWDEARTGEWRSGVKSLGLSENGVDWMLDIFNRNLISLKDEKEINKVRKDIISGKIKVVDYMDSESCPVPLIES
jgi:basic membrane protein A